MRKQNVRDKAAVTTETTYQAVPRSVVENLASRVLQSPGEQLKLVTSSVFIFVRLVKQKGEELLEVSWRKRDPITGHRSGGGDHERHDLHGNRQREIVQIIIATLSSKGVTVAA
jgi:hypothetical protein